MTSVIPLKVHAIYPLIFLMVGLLDYYQGHLLMLLIMALDIYSTNYHMFGSSYFGKYCQDEKKARKLD